MTSAKTLLFAGLLSAIPGFASSLAADGQAELAGALKDCAAIFGEIGMPSGDDGADEGDYAFANGHAPDVPKPHFLYKCYGGAFAVRMNAITKVPDWVAEDLTLEESKGSATRSNKFIDETQPSGYSSLDKDFVHADFDRGHQVPAGNFSGDQTLKDLTFYMSNMGPQIGACFNRGIWKNLEAAIKDLVETRGRLVVFTGPLYTAKLRTISDHTPEKADVNVAVPDEYFKIIYSPAENRVAALRITNRPHCGKTFRTKEFLSSVNAIEEITGFDFFPAASDRRQRLMESQAHPFWTW
ncbi:DNA/RNA non-specific endonuclease [Neorhizobium galegae]|uniref:Endonuclease n=1 Tax=Neorhizobium galegae bv. officinalis TaxID=323656 RepID=A0A0T7GHH9_NEOGA|nr:DNA/RNA non-specific endonuclease [Neorhizobium galegae]CDZ46710.1 DNA/RNA non-specific endonuclease [Neorhizobium galegae bv. officinalis]